MQSLIEKLDSYRPYALFVLRVVMGYLFILHGSDKVFDFPHIHGQEPITTFMGFAALTQLICGILLVLGLFTRFVSFYMSGQMAYAYFFVHATADTFLIPLINRGELSASFSIVFLYLIFAGGGAFALDKFVFKPRY